MFGRLRITVLGFVIVAAACGRGERGAVPLEDREQAAGATQRLIHAGRELRGALVKVDGRFRYDYYDVDEPDSSVAALSARGFQGGGPTWAGITYGLIKLRQPALLRDVEFDDEADGLAIWSRSRATLLAVAGLITDAKQDPSLLAAAIAEATKAGRME